ncbi:MAG: glutaredoxin domain-containing protein [Cyanobacteria bacterium J06559_3]
MSQPRITLFTKPNCSYCQRAKAILNRLGLNYEERDVEASDRHANASVSFSGLFTVPQIFIGDYPISGAEDLEKLQRSQRLMPIINTVSGELPPFDSCSNQALHQSAEDILLHHVIPPRDGSRTDDPEACPILHFYKQFFGFWPHTFAYLSHWPEAYKLFVYCHNFSAVGLAKQYLGDANLYAVGYSTSNAHGCAYCQVHSAATGGEQSLAIIRHLQQVRAGQADEQTPLGPLELAIADLAAAATHNQGHEVLKLISQIQALSGDLQQAKGYIVGVEMLVAALGFLNVFNDLVGLEVEGDWVQQAQNQAGIEVGRHGATRHNPNNLEQDLPVGGPSLGAMLAQYDTAVEDVQTYTKKALGLFPAWMQTWPQPLVKRHAYFYCEMMGDRDHTLISSELKHLMARVSAIAKDHAYLAAVEGFMAYKAASDKSRAISRIRHCYGAVTGQTIGRSLFTSAEMAALQFAWVSAQIPLKTPRRFVQAALDHYEPKALVHLCVVCAMASMLQRFVAIAQPKIEIQVAEFLYANNLEWDTLALRYPIPVAQAWPTAV